MLAAKTGRLGRGPGLLGGGVGVDMDVMCCWAIGICWIGKPMASSSMFGRFFDAAPTMVRLHPVGSKGGSSRPELGPAKV